MFLKSLLSIFICVFHTVPTFSDLGLYTRDVMISKSYNMILRCEVHDNIFIMIFKKIIINQNSKLRAPTHVRLLLYFIIFVCDYIREYFLFLCNHQQHTLLVCNLNS